MEKFICNACGNEKQKSSFYKCGNCKDEIVKICKTCKLQGRKSQTIKNTIHPFNESFRKSERQHYSIAGCSKNDYLEMYKLMELIGYDTNKDIHQQFLDRHNPTLEKPMKYKNREYKRENHFLPDGSVNPSSRQKKTPTTDS